MIGSFPQMVNRNPDRHRVKPGGQFALVAELVQFFEIVGNEGKKYGLKDIFYYLTIRWSGVSVKGPNDGLER